MKKITLLFLVPAVLLAMSCAGIPKPAAETDTLVIGTFLVDYRDGFFDEPPRTIQSNIRLEIHNTSTGAVFSVITDLKGYFYFLSNGADQFEIKRYSYNASGDRVSYSGGGALSYPVTAAPHCVHYLGRITVVAAHPKMTATSSNTTSWSFEYSLEREDRKPEMVQYLQDIAGETPWPAYDIE